MSLKKQKAKTTAPDYMSELINYGNVKVPRGYAYHLLMEVATKQGHNKAQSKALADRWMQAYDLRQKLAGNPNRRNPESTAVDLYEQFHGRAPEVDTEVVTEMHVHENLTGLGSLSRIVVTTIFGKIHNLDVCAPRKKNELPDPCDLPEDERTLLASNETGTQLYLEGGNQALDLGELGFFEPDMKAEHLLIGTIEQISYQTTKSHLEDEPNTIYFHDPGMMRSDMRKLGKSTDEIREYVKEHGDGVKPFLAYDTINRLMNILGGRYYVATEGIVG